MLVYGKQAKTNLEKDDYDLNWEPEKEITREEKNNDYKIPSDIMRFIIKHYYDKIIPSESKDTFDTEDLPGIRIYDFFNFNPLITSSRQLTYDVYQNGNCENYDKSAIEGTVFERNKLYPIMWASHEMIICCDSKGCIFMVCPEETVTKIGDSFDEFLGKLYMSNY